MAVSNSLISEHPAVRPEKVGPGFLRPHCLDVRHVV